MSEQEVRCNDCGYLVGVASGRGHNVLCVDLRQARADHIEAEAYAKEGWEWLDEALNALGCKDVFEMRARFPKWTRSPDLNKVDRSE